MPAPYHSDTDACPLSLCLLKLHINHLIWLFPLLNPGLLDTIQDMGRNGFGNWGISPGGAMDIYAAQVANLLVGNSNHEAVIEIHFPGPQILFEQNTLIAIAGADFSPTINDEIIPRWQPVVVRKNTVLHFPGLIEGKQVLSKCSWRILPEKMA